MTSDRFLSVYSVRTYLAAMIGVRPFGSRPPCMRAPGRVISQNWHGPRFPRIGRLAIVQLVWEIFTQKAKTCRVLPRKSELPSTFSVSVDFPQSSGSRTVILPVCRSRDTSAFRTVSLLQHGWKWLQKPCPVYTQVRWGRIPTEIHVCHGWFLG